MEQSWPILAKLAPSGGYLGTLFGLAWGYLVLLGAILSHLGTILNPNPKFNDSLWFLTCSGPLLSDFGVDLEPSGDPFWEPFWDQIGPRGAKMAPRGPSRAPKYRKPTFAKTLKNNWFFKVFANTGFRYFEALDGPLGPILAPLEPIWSQNYPQKLVPE